jgi:putative spermidine/putrescine transport system permease protein
MESRTARILAALGTIGVLGFLYGPLVVIAIYAFNPSIGQSWPLPGLTTKWFGVAWRNGDVRQALLTSIEAGAGATTIALVLGSAAAFAVHRFRFFGRETVSFALVLPIALPGIVTAMALNSAINTIGIPFSVFTIIIGHATFCVVVVYNNVIARLRRTPTSLVEASMDLGGDGWQTFRFVTLPSIMTALVAGALLAFALSFDEIVVTNYTSGAELTLPKFIFDNLRQPHNRPIVNVVAVAIVLLSLVPVYLAQRLTGRADVVAAAAKAQSESGVGFGS